MISFLTNATVRSAGDLLADLAACRSLRHLSGDNREAVCDTAFDPKPTEYRSPKEVVAGITCDDCGKPRSKYGVSKCHACYRNKPKEFIWTSEAFKIAVSGFGYCCDVCDVVTPVPADRIEAATNRILENLDGRANPILCAGCSQLFLAFCTREFGRDGRAIRSEDFEKLNLAWIASNVKRAGKKISLGMSARDKRREPA